jgi:hypothetical protein
MGIFTMAISGTETDKEKGLTLGLTTAIIKVNG